MEASTMRVVDETLSRIDSITDSHPPTDGSSPLTMGPEAFFAKYGRLYLTDYAEAYMLASGGVNLLEAQTNHSARVAGALIRKHLSNEELTEIGRDN